MQRLKASYSLVLFGMAVATASANNDFSFERFVHKHNKFYSTAAERATRKALFEARVRDAMLARVVGADGADAALCTDTADVALSAEEALGIPDDGRSSPTEIPGTPVTVPLVTKFRALAALTAPRLATPSPSTDAAPTTVHLVDFCMVILLSCDGPGGFRGVLRFLRGREMSGRGE